MASGFMRNLPETYIVIVREIGRGRRIVEKKKFTDYDKANYFHDSAETRYGQRFIVEFDTKFG